MKKKIELSVEQIIALKVIANGSFELLDALRSVTHSASIRKGYKHPKLVSDEIGKDENVMSEENRINLSNLEINFIWFIVWKKV